MTRIMFITPDQNVAMSVDTQEAIPVVGDIIVAPGGAAIYRVIQRAFVVDRAPTDKLVDLSRGQPLSITIQCAVTPVELVAETEGMVQ